MLLRFAKICLALSVAASIGLHWAFFQSVAWVGMVVTYSHEAPFREALVKTFDGKHPCALCREIANDRRSEKKPDSPPPVRKLEFSYSAAQFLFAAPSHFWEPTCPEQFWAVLAQAPPVPPPKKILG